LNCGLDPSDPASQAACLAAVEHLYVAFEDVAE
jgi:hypothetical protein